MSRIRADKFVNNAANGAPQLTYGAEVVVGVGLTGAGGINITGVATAASFSGNLTGNATGLTGTPNIDCGTGSFTGDVDIADKIIHTGDTDTAIRFPAADNFTVETGGTERARVNSGGVLLGLTAGVGAGAAPADLNSTEIGRGFINLSRDDTAAVDHILFGKNGSIAASVGTDTTNTLVFKTGTTEKLRITSAGRFGFNTGSPDAEVHIEPVGSNASILLSNDGRSQYFRIQNNESADALVFNANDSNERLRIQSGGGISFNGDTAAANALDDYEEGTWSPNIGGTATYTLQEGRYTKIGRLVSLSAILIINARGNGSQTTISGFPFTGRATTSGNPSASGVITTASNLATSVTSLTLYLGSGTTSAIFAGFTGASTSNTNAPNIFQNSTRIDFSMTYEA